LIEEPRAKRPLKPVPEAEPVVVQAPDSVAETWAKLPTLTLDPTVLDRNLVVAASRKERAHAPFDVLRTKLLHVLSERNWRRVGVTSPTKGCGKSFVAVNLAISLARYESCRTVLLDMDLRLSSIARRLGVREPASMGDYLRGLIPLEDYFRRVGPNPFRIGSSLAIGMNGRPEPFASELFHEPCLSRIDAALAPRAVLFDLPPALAFDDVLALKPHLDCVLIVAGGGMTTARELRETSRRLGDDLPIVGVILNKAEGEGTMDYYY
jgi:Mrp family chromosome partitioning ATPase